MSLKSIGSNLAVALLLAAAATAAKADVIFFSGDLRTDANVTAAEAAAH